MRKLHAEQIKSLRDALLSAFPDSESLQMMLAFQLDQNIHAITKGGNLKFIVYELIQWALAAGRLEELVDGALAEAPGNPDLRQWVKSNLKGDFQSSAREADKVGDQEFTSADQFQLAELLKKSGRITTRSAREALCYQIDVDSNNFDFMDAAAHDFAVLLISRLYRMDHIEVLQRLCDVIAPSLRGQNSTMLNTIKSRLNQRNSG